jgi:hypothetical protein
MASHDVKARADEVRAMVAEGKVDEAHAERDRLFVDVLHSIANGQCPDPGASCREALQLAGQ